MTHGPAAPLLKANELALMKLLNEQPVGENLPRIAEGPRRRLAAMAYRDRKWTG
jgi:hypothetical protein